METYKNSEARIKLIVKAMEKEKKEYPALYENLDTHTASVAMEVYVSGFMKDTDIELITVVWMDGWTRGNRQKHKI
jgi:hypothetical protein